MTTDTLHSAPWYRVPMVWLIIAIPGMTIAGCMLTIFLAISNPDPVLPRIDAQPLAAKESARP